MNKRKQQNLDSFIHKAQKPGLPELGQDVWRYLVSFLGPYDLLIVKQLNHWFHECVSQVALTTIRNSIHEYHLENVNWPMIARLERIEKQTHYNGNFEDWSLCYEGDLRWRAQTMANLFLLHGGGHLCFEDIQGVALQTEVMFATLYLLCASIPKFNGVLMHTDYKCKGYDIGDLAAYFGYRRREEPDIERVIQINGSPDSLEILFKNGSKIEVVAIDAFTGIPDRSIRVACSNANMIVHTETNFTRLSAMWRANEPVWKYEDKMVGYLKRDKLCCRIEDWSEIKCNPMDENWNVAFVKLPLFSTVRASYNDLRFHFRVFGQHGAELIPRYQSYMLLVKAIAKIKGITLDRDPFLYALMNGNTVFAYNCYYDIYDLEDEAILDICHV